MRNKNALTHEQFELYLFVINTRIFYPGLQQIERNFMRRKIRGDYDSLKAPQAFSAIVLRAATRYHLDFGTPGTRVSETFSVEDRRAVCEALAVSFEAEFSCGNVDFSPWTIAAIRKNPEFIKHNPFYFDPETLAFFGEYISEMRVSAPHRITDYCGVTHFCFGITAMQHNTPSGPQERTHFFDIQNFKRVFTTEE
jgi:hypothetical protein